MMRSAVVTRCLASFLLVVLITSSAAPAPPAASELVGFWRGSIDAPDQESPIPVEVKLEREGDHWRGSVAVPGDHSPLIGDYDDGTTPLRFEADFDDDTTLRVTLSRGSNDSLTGSAVLGKMTAPVTLHRSTETPKFFHDRGISLPDELPSTVDTSTLEAKLTGRIAALLASTAERTNAIGVSTAIVVDGKIADVRSLGFEDLEGRVPATGASMYRWASISKPLTAVAAMQLVAAGKLDLDRDVRTYVPEFPEKPRPITSRQLLGHLGGVVHYSNGRVIATEREYDVPHPWADTILCLDRFKESPLVSVPGTEFNYTTHGYMLLGAAVERAGKAPFAEQVRRRVLAPLGMTSMQPDYPFVDIPHRVNGYRGLRIGLAARDPHRDVHWKLPGGGWISNISDLARFGAGMMEPGKLLDKATMHALATEQQLPNGRGTGYGLGIGITRLDDHDLLCHSGSQSKTRTYMALCPKKRIGVFVMSNTTNFPVRTLAMSMMREVLAHPDPAGSNVERR